MQTLNTLLKQFAPLILRNMEKLKPSRRFLFVFDDLDATTVHKNVGLYAQFLAEQGVGVDFITAKLPKNANVKFVQKNINIIRIPAREQWPQLDTKSFSNYLENNINKYFCIWVYRGRPYAKFVVDISKKNNVTTAVKLDSDVSFSSFGNYFFRICKKFKIDALTFYNSSCYVIKFFSVIPGIKGFEKYDAVLFKSSLVLCESKNVYKKLESSIPGISASYFPNSLPVKKYDLYLRDFQKKVKQKGNLIISVGRIVPVKYYEEGIKAFSLLPKDFKNKWRYEIIGPVFDKDYLKKLKDLIRELNLEKNIQIISGLYGRDLFLKYFTSSILLMPYKVNKNEVQTEGQPNVIPQGMFFKNAVITTAFPGTKSFIDKKSNDGILLENNSPEIIKGALESIMKDRKKLTRIQGNAHTKVVNDFNLDHIAEKIWTKILEIDYATYLQDQKSDTLALEPEVIRNAVYKYLDFLTLKIKTINFKNAKILDIGCREFYTYDYFKKKFNNIIQGIEIGPEALSFAKRKNITEVDIHVMTKVFKKNSFDVILSFHVLEHMYDLPLALKNCYTILKKNGILFFAIPMPAHDTRRSHWLEISSQKEMVKLLEEVGFDPIFYKTFEADVFRNEPEMIGMFIKR